MPELNDDSIWAIASHPLSIARMLWKQKLAVVVVALLIAVPCIAFVLRLPAIYKAETVILVDSEKIPEKFVSATSSTNLRERVEKLSQNVLSSARLSKIVETFDLYPEQRRSLSIQETAELMRSDVKIQFESASLSEDRPGRFVVSYQGGNPTTVAQVTNELGNLLVNENLHSREAHAEETLQFIQATLEQAKKNLEEQEARIGDYKLQHNGELPEQAAFLTANLNQLGDQLHGNQEAISQAYSSQATLRSGLQLAQTLARMSERQGKRPEEADHTAAGQPEISGENPEEVKKELQAELDSLLKKYTESHPKVRLLRASIARIKALEDKQQLVAAFDPDHTENLKVQLAAVDREIKDRSDENRRLIQEIHAVQARLGNIPIREHELIGLTRDYELSKDNYKTLLDKLHEAEMEADMERRQKAERFTVLEPAHVPDRPVKPNRRLLIVWSVVLAVLAGVVLAFVREMKKNNILGEWELPSGTVVYGRVPAIGSGTLARVGLGSRIRGRLHSLRPVVNGRHESTRVEGYSNGQLTAPQKALMPLPMSPAAGPQFISALSTGVRRQIRSIRPTSPAICLDDSYIPALEQYRIARTKIEFDPRGPKLLAVTSACEGDGKSISAINLARAFAMRSDAKILLVGGDFRHPSMPELLGIPPRPGITDVLSGRCELSDAMVDVEQIPNLCVLPAGTPVANVTELLITPAWQSLCDSFREQFTFTIIDTPPVGSVADYDLIENICDGVIMVVRPDHTNRTFFRIAHGAVLPGKMLGVLMNAVEDWFLWKTSVSSYGYYAPRQ